jgi:hypothetical protein
MYETRITPIALLSVLLLLVKTDAFSQSAQMLKGVWTNESGTRKTEFFNENERWFGKLIWAEDESKLKPGHMLFEDLVWDGHRFAGRAIVARGAANCTISFESNDKIKVQASKGSMSKSVYWTRAK